MESVPAAPLSFAGTIAQDKDPGKHFSYLWLDGFRLASVLVMLVLTLSLRPELVLIWGIYLAYLPLFAGLFWLSRRDGGSAIRLWIMVFHDTLLIAALGHLVGTGLAPVGLGYGLVLVGYMVAGGARLGLACLLTALASHALILVLENYQLLEARPLMVSGHPEFTNPAGALGAWVFVVAIFLMAFAWLSLVVRRILAVQARRQHSLAAQKLALDRSARMTEFLEQFARLEGLGNLAGKVAHDFNSLLTVILGFTGEVAARIGSGKKVGEDLGEITKAARRAQVFVSQLLAFSRRQSNERTLLDLNRMLIDFHQALAPILLEGRRVQLDLCSEALWVQADAGQLRQILVLLASNAQDAMVGEGTFILRTRRLDVGFGPAPSSEWAELIVADDGPGMASSVAAKIFDPFFTTKPPSHGTGLGLSVVYGLALQNDGRVRVDTAPGHGTRFHISLPLQTKAVD